MLGIIKPTKKNGNECFENINKKIVLKDFWSWAYSDLMGNTERGKLAEFIVAKKLNKPVIKSDVGYFIPALKGFPGPFLKYINNMLSSEEVLKLMENKEDRRIILKECLTYATPEGKTKQFINEKNAKLCREPFGKGSTFDKIVIFEGQEYPKSLNSDKENVEHFKKTLKIYEQMADYLCKL